MQKWIKAKIKWISPEEGGRQTPVPAGTRYCPIIIFPNTSTENAWSADIFTSETDENGESIITLSFLVSEAPFELLKKGEQFELYEGNKMVARGVLC